MPSGPTPTRVFLARHGGTTASDAGLFAGASDPELSQLGLAQATRLGQRLAKEPVSRVVCSDMKRTIATAAAIASPHGLHPEPDPAWREVDHGHWEGLPRDEVLRRWPDEYADWSNDPYNFAPAGGQPGSAVLGRALPALERIVRENPGRTVVIVSHTATNRLLLCVLLGIDPRRYRDRLAQDLACLNLIEFRPQSGPRLLLMNDTSHLTGL